MSIVPPQSLHYRVLGAQTSAAKAPLVLLHGLMGFAANWGKVWPFFDRERLVLAFDQRGHGRSEKPNHGYAPEDYARDLKTLLDELGWTRAHIVGHSMGGRVALAFAHGHPSYCISLTMEDSGAGPRPDRSNWIRGLLGGIPTPFPDREEAKRFFSESFQGDPLTAGFLHANLETKPGGSLDWRFHAPGMIETVEKGRCLDAFPQFRSIVAPTLLVRGERSVEFPQNEAEEMAGARKNVELVVIPGAGHFVHAEAPKPFSEALASFIARVENGAS